MSLYISRLEKDDAGIIDSLNYIIFKGHSVYSLEYLTEVCKKQHGFMINIDNNPAGYIFCDYHTNEITKTSVLTIMSLGVLEEYRRVGLGRTLLKSVFELFQGEDIYLHVSTKNPHAQELYMSEGFIIIGHLPKYYKFPNSETEDADVMVKYNEVNQYVDII